MDKKDYRLQFKRKKENMTGMENGIRGKWKLLIQEGNENFRIFKIYKFIKQKYADNAKAEELFLNENVPISNDLSAFFLIINDNIFKM